jgi:hypothetical protein
MFTERTAALLACTSQEGSIPVTSTAPEAFNVDEGDPGFLLHPSKIKK